MKKFVLYFILFVFSISVFPQVPSSWCTIPDDHLDNDKNQVLEDWYFAGTDAFRDKEGNPVKLKVEMLDVSLEPYNIIPNTQTDLAPAITEMIDEVSKTAKEPTILFFPEGKYILEGPLVLPGNIILKGAGAKTISEITSTHLLFRLYSDLTADCISIEGEHNGVEDMYLSTFAPFEITEVPSEFTDDKKLIYNVEYVTKFNTVVKDEDGNIIYQGKGIVYNNKVETFTCDGELIDEGVYNVTSTFSGGGYTGDIVHTVTYNAGKTLGDSTKSGSSKANFKDHLGGYTIKINGSNNWVKGVNFEKTQKMHLYISGGYSNEKGGSNSKVKGQHNTVSGCYFHESYNYGGGGHGYGVCLSGRGATKFNLIENNVFYKLRHSIVLQYEVSRNVIAYNSSIDAKRNKGDIILHCAEDDSTGPNLNLFEGNIAERIIVDQKELNSYYHNNPYNTYFRNRAIYKFQISRVKNDYKPLQCAQNVVGCNMDPNWDPRNGSTLHKLKIYGWKEYYNNWNKWKKLPDGYESYYYNLYNSEEGPVYFTSGFDWPFVPKRSNVSPARDRWNIYHADWDNTKIPVAFQGYVNYDLDCAEEELEFKNITWYNQEEGYGAEQLITLDNCLIKNGNDLQFKAGEKILLTNNTHIYPGNAVRFTYGGNFCFFGKKQKTVESQSSVFEKLGLENDCDIDTALLNDIRIYPNPNFGSFKIQSNFTLQKENIQIFDILGNKVSFRIFDKSIRLSHPFNGIIFLHLQVQDKIIAKKLVVNEK